MNAYADRYSFHQHLIESIGFAPVSNVQLERDCGPTALADVHRGVALGLVKPRVVSTNSCGKLIVQYRVYG